MKVTVFHTTNCAFCKTEMQWLDSKHVAYEHRNIEIDKDALDYLLYKTGQSSVPVTFIEHDSLDIVRGFDRNKLSLILGV